MKTPFRTWMQSANVAFSLYSAIPMPQVKWTESNMKYALCFFPLVGLVEGLILLLWIWFCGKLQLGVILFAAGATAIPAAVSGGIHLDGFCDTVDALASHQTKERKLEILKDPHSGAFAVIACMLYLLLTFALWSEGGYGAMGHRALILAGSLVLTRALSGFSVVTFPCAKTSGLAATFSDAAEKSRVRGVMLAWVALVVGGMAGLAGWSAILVCIGSGTVLFGYYRMAMKQFGGITGDLAGYFLQINQLVLLGIINLFFDR